MMNTGYSTGGNLLEETRKFFRQGSALSVLILINIGIWLIIQVFRVFLFFLNDPEGGLISAFVLHFLAIPASIPDLILKPWTIVTYNFLHLDIWHILFNMLWLFWFGRIFTEFLTSRQLVFVYVLGGITGGLVYVLAFNIFPVFSEMVPVSFALGASASVMAIVAAISFYVPNYSIHLLFLGKLRIGYLAVALFVFDFFMIPSGNAGGHIAHIGGAIFGAVYIYIYRIQGKAFEPGNKFDLFGRVEQLFRRKKPDMRAGTGFYERPVSDDEYNRRKKDHQQKIDEILEKISKGGYDSLTREEKEYLFKSSGKR